MGSVGTVPLKQLPLKGSKISVFKARYTTSLELVFASIHPRYTLTEAQRCTIEFSVDLRAFISSHHIFFHLTFSIVLLLFD